MTLTVSKSTRLKKMTAIKGIEFDTFKPLEIEGFSKLPTAKRRSAGNCLNLADF